LPPMSKKSLGKKTLVLDLDETLVHSSFKPIDNADIVQPVEIDGKVQYVYVLKRPFCEEFIFKMSSHYEIIMFTASLSKYAEPLYAKLDPKLVTETLLYREHCTFYNGLFVKDMARLGRNLEDVIIIDNSPTSYLFQPENALPSISWYDDKGDRELLDMIPILEKLAKVKDVRMILP
jgi:carboxy-terminal domain RNA polymerase II polypeptide A small phosphatase